MWNKIFIVLFAAAVLGMLALTFLSYSQLQHIGFPPKDLAEGFKFYADIYWKFLFVSTLILLVVSDVILWLARRSWPLWSTFLFFAVFVVVQTWWLGKLLNDYETANRLAADSFYGQYFTGALLCITAGVIFFFDQFLILRMRDRIQKVEKPADDGGEVPVENPPSEEI